jgi:MFS family permease
MHNIASGKGFAQSEGIQISLKKEVSWRRVREQDGFYKDRSSKPFYCSAFISRRILMAEKVPGTAWRVVFAGMAINLCLGVLYAWSIWKAKLVNLAKAKAGEVMTGIDAGWPYLTDAQGTVAFFTCGIVFALLMIPGGRIQDKYGPKVGATIGGLSLALGCYICGAMKSYWGLVLGLGVFGGIGMGIGYAAPTPAALKWFGPHKRGLIAGLVVGGYGGAALYISPVAKWAVDTYGISGSFYLLGTWFAAVTIIAGQLLAWPQPGYVPPAPPVKAGAAPAKAVGTAIDWAPSEIPKTWQFYALVFMFICSAQCGLIAIANAMPILMKAGKKVAFFAANAWILASFGGLMNAIGRPGTGITSDKIGRENAFTFNGLVLAVICFLLPAIIASENLVLLFLAVGFAFWQYGGTLALMPAYTADFFGPKNLGMNYGLVFIGWGIAFVIPWFAGYIKDWTGTWDIAFYVSGVLLILGVIVSRVAKRPLHVTE